MWTQQPDEIHSEMSSVKEWKKRVRRYSVKICLRITFIKTNSPDNLKCPWCRYEKE